MAFLVSRDMFQSAIIAVVYDAWNSFRDKFNLYLEAFENVEIIN